jgi:hypothetical protein
MNLNSHALLALSVGMVFTHNTQLAVLIGIGAILPDIDREYVFTKRKIFQKYQFHRALFHNVFFAAAVSTVNPYLGVGVISHIFLDTLTSPTDRGVELFFPISRLVKNVYLNLNGDEINSKGVLWYLEDPVRLVAETADPGLKEVGKNAWRRVYGPFKNSRLADWEAFYSSLLFLLIYVSSMYGLANWIKSFLYYTFDVYLLFVIGIILFYGAGEAWRRRLQTQGTGKPLILGMMVLGVLLMVYQGIQVYSPPKLDTALLGEITVSVLAGLLVAYVHVRLRVGAVIL